MANRVMQSAHNLAMQVLGKTLKVHPSPTGGVVQKTRNTMFALLAQVANFFRSSASEPSHASTLMEAADSMAGFDARQAQELRAAASAWLSVVR